MTAQPVKKCDDCRHVRTDRDGSQFCSYSECFGMAIAACRKDPQDSMLRHILTDTSWLCGPDAKYFVAKGN